MHTIQNIYSMLNLIKHEIYPVSDCIRTFCPLILGGGNLQRGRTFAVSTANDGCPLVSTNVNDSTFPCPLMPFLLKKTG